MFSICSTDEASGRVASENKASQKTNNMMLVVRQLRGGTSQTGSSFIPLYMSLLCNQNLSVDRQTQVKRYNKMPHISQKARFKNNLKFTDFDAATPHCD